ncbi:MAG: hypothetical protein OES46_13385 [Gammaproteobacteria bacterium]|jgi:hypothetical protein|nr:hypothetical protein [Gammaproteobacteria bacterium]
MGRIQLFDLGRKALPELKRCLTSVAFAQGISDSTFLTVMNRILLIALLDNVGPKIL